ncbi:MAG: DNA primase [Candidatus Cyclobacteriaceae bacterium M3_2C_046]
MLKISEHTKNEIINIADIQDVVGDFIQLKKRGQNLIARCPFHDEKTPSFIVSPAKGIYKCFGCGKGGDAISFVMEHESINYVEALKYLAQKYGIEIEEEVSTDEEIQKHNERDSLFILLNYANEYFKKNLWETADGQAIGLTYFKERGYNHQVIKRFELGYTLEKWDAFYQKASQDGFSGEMLEKAGLIRQKESKTYDYFRGRVIFPIHNLSGKVIAFGARTLKSEIQPKYLNSPETEVYHKSKILYGAYQAKQAIRQHNNCYLVEGYTDVISLHLCGVEHVVASSGTSLTDEQIKLIGRMTENVTVLFDGDKAGIKASLRGIDMILHNGLNVKAVAFPQGEDPDSYSRKVGSAAFQAYLQEHAVDFIRFKLDLFRDEIDQDPIRKSQVIKEIIESIARIPDPVKRSVYIQESSKMLDMDESVLLSEQNKILIRQNQEKRRSNQQEDVVLPSVDEKPEKSAVLDTDKIISLQEKESIRLLINYGLNQIEEEYHLYRYLLDELEEIEFNHPVYSRILTIFKEHLAQGQVIDAEFLIKNGSEEIKAAVIDLVTDKYELSQNWLEKYNIYVPREADNLKNVVFTNIVRLKFRVVRKLIEQNLKEMSNQENQEEQIHFMKVHTELKKSEMELARLLGNVVIR